MENTNLELDERCAWVYQIGMANTRDTNVEPFPDMDAEDEAAFVTSNRIREIRLEKGLTAEQLGTLVGTSGPTISRLERGVMDLTEEWMRRIAKALNVEPADLLESATFMNMEDEVEPLSSGISASISGALHSEAYMPLKIKGKQLELLGYSDGYEALFSCGHDAKAKAETGDVVLVQVTRKADGKTARVVRQFVRPAMLVTNRAGRNLTISLDEPKFRIEIVGVMVTNN